jgi:hypothetical protein
MAQEENNPRTYPYDPFEGLFYIETFDWLRSSKKDGEVHIPTVARRVLEELRQTGLLHRRDTEPPENIRKAKIGNRQEIWIRFDTFRDNEGYMAVDVVDPPRSDAAILAAMTALIIEPVDLQQVVEAIQFLHFPEGLVAPDEVLKTIVKWLKSNPDNVGKTALEKERQVLPLAYIVPLLLYYRPELRDHSEQEFFRYVDECSRYINVFLNALRNLQGFLEYGDPDQHKLTPAAKHAKRDVQAAVLGDVDGLSYRQIGERLRVPPPRDIEIKRDHQTVRAMVKRGRRILEEAFGKEGWRERAKTMRADKARWQSLSYEEQDKEIEIERTARELDISIEEARQQVERSDS